MIGALSIQNFALIDQLFLEFSGGLTVFSGETGAGKSIILNALGFALGKKLPAKSFRDPSKPIVVSAEIDCKDVFGLSDWLKGHSIIEDKLVLRRVMTPDGRTRSFINENLVSASLLEEISPYLLEISGQHNQYSLLNNKMHIKMLDEYAQLSEELSKLSSLFFQLKGAKLELKELLLCQANLSEEQSYIKHMIEEIRKIEPKSGEEEELSKTRKLLMNQTKLKESLEDSINSLSSGALPPIYSVQKSFSKFPEELSGVINRLESVVIEIEEALSFIKNFMDKFDNLGSLKQVEDRLFSLKDLARKHSVPVDDLSEVLTKMEEKLEYLSNLSKAIVQKQEQVRYFSALYSECAKVVSKNRTTAAIELRKAILKELNEIKMDKSDVIIEIIEQPEENWDETGIDKVTFLVKTNPGSNFCEIKNSASGGELSRIMLAYKIAITNTGQTPTLIFDEVDSGIGGAVASSVGKKLATLAKNFQVIVVTHQPQVASYSNNHYLVRKNHLKMNTILEVELLTDMGKKQEIARMLAGEAVTNESIFAAESLIKSSKIN